MPDAQAGTAAGGDEAEDDLVAGGEPGDARADLLDDAGALVPADDRQRGGQVTGDDVLVGVAQPAAAELDEDLPLPSAGRARSPRPTSPCSCPTAPQRESSRDLLRTRGRAHGRRIPKPMVRPHLGLSMPLTGWMHER